MKIMEKALDNEILWQIHALAIEKNIDFKKWFEDEEEITGNIHENPEPLK